MLNTFWNATKIDAITAMLAQRVLDAISTNMVVRAPKRRNRFQNAFPDAPFVSCARFPDIAASEGRVR